MSEIQAMIQLRHGPPEPTWSYIEALPSWVVDEWSLRRLQWSRRYRGVECQCLPTTWSRSLLINYLDRPLHQEIITELLQKYYAEHHE
jgi:hypothetical protein